MSDPVLQSTPEPKAGWQVAEDAGRAFDAWLSGQSDTVQEMSLLDQIGLYAEEANGMGMQP